ncbi:hypothetical protein EJ06DRAFT_90801 [Trichodelitschia bisporula]|uniref:Uncharacterized protein n=1 Tax=Trichodelitschia bisporula TaxID=703511 RepID=A0A6G1HS58_9PEZI|nr:hypothetical protein EJ06DRAFT_90801 [Trichodelitschia bisporula]
MGACASCLGVEADPFAQAETSPLITDLAQQYGTVEGGQHNAPDVDPAEIRRQRDLLERLCAETQDNLIDAAQVSNPGSGLGMSELERLFRKHFGGRPDTTADIAPEEDAPPPPSPQAWLQDVKATLKDDLVTWGNEGVGPLVMTFDNVFNQSGKSREV